MGHADVLIVGAGLAGTSVAWHLAGRRRVAIVEQGEQALAEASAQNAGMVRRLGSEPAERALACRSYDLLSRLPGEDWDDGSPFRTTGAVLALTEKPELLDTDVHALQSRGIAVEDVPLRHLAELAPALAGSPATRAWFLPEEGVCDAWRLGSGFLRGARRRGAGLELETRVESLIVEGGRVVGIATDRGPRFADRIVLATAAWSERLCAPLGIERPLVPIARHLFFSDDHAAATVEHPWCWIEDQDLYIRPETGGFLCSPCDETAVRPPDGPGSRRVVDAYYRALAQDKLTRFAPAVADLRLARGWIGLRTFAPDRLPYLGADPDWPGLVWATGLGGFGVTCAFAVGEAVASDILDDRVDWLDWDATRPGRRIREVLLPT